MAERKCETCEWADAKDIEGALLCKRFPPVVNEGETYLFFSYPEMQKNDWCGEHKQKEGERE